MVSVVPPAKRERISVEDYLAAEERADIRHEYVDGILYAMPGTTKRHHRWTLRLARLLDVTERGCQVYAENVKVYPASNLYYYPDIVVSCNDTSQDERVVANPCLIIEVMSESSRDKDRREKWLAYKQILTLAAYLLFEQDEVNIECRVREGDSWVHHVLTEGSIALSCPEVALSSKAIYQGIIDV